MGELRFIDPESLQPKVEACYANNLEGEFEVEYLRKVTAGIQYRVDYNQEEADAVEFECTVQYKTDKSKDVDLSISSESVENEGEARATVDIDGPDVLQLPSRYS